MASWPRDEGLCRSYAGLLAELLGSGVSIVEGSDDAELLANILVDCDLAIVIDWHDRPDVEMGDVLRHVLCSNPHADSPKVVFCSPISIREFEVRFNLPSSCDAWRGRLTIADFPTDVYRAISACQRIARERIARTRSGMQCEACTVFQADGHVPGRQHLWRVGHQLKDVFPPLTRWLGEEARWPDERKLLADIPGKLSTLVTSAEGAFLPERERVEVARFLAEVRTVAEWLKRLCSMANPPRKAPEVVRGALENAVDSRACAIYGPLRRKAQELWELGCYARQGETNSRFLVVELLDVYLEATPTPTD